MGCQDWQEAQDELRPRQDHHGHADKQGWQHADHLFQGLHLHVVRCRQPDTNEEVRTERRFMDFTTNTPLLSSDINKFIEFGGQKIKFTQDEVRGMAKSVLRDCQGLKLLAFKPINKLDWSYFVRSNHFIYPEESMVKGSKQLFVALMKKCVEKQVAAICAYKYRAITGKNDAP